MIQFMLGKSVSEETQKKKQKTHTLKLKIYNFFVLKKYFRNPNYDS